MSKSRLARRQAVRNRAGSRCRTTQRQARHRSSMCCHLVGCNTPSRSITSIKGCCRSRPILGAQTRAGWHSELHLSQGDASSSAAWNRAEGANTTARETSSQEEVKSYPGKTFPGVGEPPAPPEGNWQIKKLREKWTRDKSKNSGITSVDRSTKATLSTYNPWIQVSRLQKICHIQHKKLRLTKNSL